MLASSRAPRSRPPSTAALVTPAGATLLRAADERVDAALNSASKVYTDNTAYLQQQLARQKEFHAANLETYRQAREAYLKKVGARPCSRGRHAGGFVTSLAQWAAQRR